MKLRYLMATSLCLCADGAAFAEGRCPPGYYPVDTPGVAGCAPIPVIPQTGPARSAQPQWETRWGAIAIDGTNSVVGAVTGMQSKRKAEKAAIKQCRAKGGDRCEVELAYYNQCGVIAWGDTGYVTAGSATVPEASELAVRQCNQSTSNCRVYYADCSLPEHIQ